MTKSRIAITSWVVGAVWVSGLSLILSPACGSTDDARQDRTQPELPGGAGTEGDGGVAGQGPAPVGGTGSNVGGAGSPGESLGGAAGEDTGGTSAGSGGAGEGGGAGEAGAGGAPLEDCESVEPSALASVWTTNCNGYRCAMTITPAGEFGNGCSNGQYETGTLAAGQLDTLGEGGAFQPYSTKGTLSRTACDSVTRDYIGQIPPNTGPEQTYSCVMTRSPACAPSLLEALAGVWNGACGSSTCVTTITAQGAMSSICSNGQSSTGSVEPNGHFSDVGSGGNFPAYSTTGVVGLTDCNSFIMPYTWQSPPNTGKKTSSQCTYTRQQDQ